MNSKEDFKNSIVLRTLLKDTLIDVSEAIIDSIISNEILKSIPIIGWISKSITAVDQIRTNFLVKKILIFLKGISDIEEDELQKFQIRYLSNAKDKDKIYEALLIAIDRFNHEDKSRILVSLFKSLIRKEIDISFFFRSVNILDTLYIDDLKEYISGKLNLNDERPYAKANVNQLFLSLGLIKSYFAKRESSVQRVHNEESITLEYMHSDFGNKFMKACNIY
jgi:hypothetical protein